MRSRSARVKGALVALATVCTLTVSEGVTADRGAERASLDEVDARGPHGEVPVRGITKADVELLSASTGMSLAESRFILFEGSKQILDFATAHRAHPGFGGVNVTQDGALRIQLRITDEASALAGEFAQRVGHPVEVFVGGRSAVQLEQDVRAVQSVMRSSSLGAADPVPYRITTDFASGRVVVRTPPAARAAVDSLPLPVGVEVVADATVIFEESASFAGTERNPGCTVGFAMQNGAGTHSLMTSGHCTDTGSINAYGFNLGNAMNESCWWTDSQHHTTPTNQIWEGFYNNAEQWTIIHAVAGGWYPGQNFFRRGRNTKATGTISDIETASVGAGGDCGVRNVTGFVLTNATGDRIEGGDSGGPMMLAYSGNWYLGGIASTTGPSGSGGRVAWRTIPAGWTACTAQFGC